MGWEELPDMSRPRRDMMCGLVTDSSGNRKIIVAGGFSTPDYTLDNNHEFKDVESFNLQTMTWQEEAKFPFVPVAMGTNIPYGNSFLSIGGHTKGNPWSKP